MIVTTDFENAASDLQYLLERGFHMKSILKIVSDRYQLNQIQRSLLYRGITTRQNAIVRKSKLINESGLKGQKLTIDTYNVLITIYSYLKGKPVFLAFDGMVRDAGKLKAKISRHNDFDRPLRLLVSYLKSTSAEKYNLLIDEPVKDSEALYNDIKEAFQQEKTQVKIKRIQKADDELLKEKSGIIATSDTEIIDKTNLPIFDLARHILNFHFKVNFLNLQSLINR